MHWRSFLPTLDFVIRLFCLSSFSFRLTSFQRSFQGSFNDRLTVKRSYGTVLYRSIACRWIARWRIKSPSCTGYKGSTISWPGTESSSLFLNYAPGPWDTRQREQSHYCDIFLGNSQDANEKEDCTKTRTSSSWNLGILPVPGFNESLNTVFLEIVLRLNYSSKNIKSVIISGWGQNAFFN